MNRSDSTPLLKRPAMHPPHCPFSSKFPHADQQLCSHRSSLEPASGRSRAALPTYSSLEDPHLVDYFERKFGNVTGSYASRLGIGGFGASGAVGSRGRSGRSGQEVTYKLSITTADSEGSGTDAPVFVSLHGSHGTMGRRKLAKKSASAGRKPRAAGGGGGFRFRRGSTNSFKMKSPDLGDLQSLTVENAGTEERDSWLLQSVEVTNLVSKKTWLFLNNRWLSLFKEDCKTVRQLGAIKCSKTSYEVLVFTGDQDGAGTDSRIFLTLFGQAGVTRRLPLRSGPGEQRTVLKRNSSRRFVLKAVCVGPLKKARVQLEETGSSAEWLLDRLQVTDLRHPKWRYHFVCGQWLSRRRGDFQTVRELVASREPGAAPKNTTFKIKVYTGDKAGAGTDADVFLKLTGDKADSNDIALNEPTMGGRNLFERNSVDEFMYKSRYLGQLQRARVWHNNKGFAPGWYLEKLIVEDLAMGRVYEFPCAQWLADSEGDRKTSRDLIARSTSGTGVGPDGLISYTILVKTGNVRNAGTSARVYLTLRSDAETPRKRSIRGPIQSDKLFLKDGKFERDAIDEFNIDLPDLLSPVTKIDIGHDNSGPGPGWFLDWVQIYCPVTGIEQTFVCKDWLDTKSGCDKTIVEDKSLRKLRSLQEEWIAEVYTGNMQNAGTDARVFLALYGDLGKSEDIYLGDDDNKKDYFVKGKMDSFKLHLPAVGTPFKLRIGHDNSGVAAGWFLEKVVMQRPSTREAFEFRCDRWLAESEDDKSCIRELPALGSTVLESLKVHKYHVLVKTGKMRLAGTDANVYCNLFGNKSDTGNRPLKYSETNKDPFERKKEDLFTLEAIGLGDQIEKVRIGHDGTNPGAGWYLEKLTVWRDDQPDKKFEFVCDRWLDKNEDDGQIERDLTLIGSMLDKMSYNVSVKTGDVAGAGTDANVFLTIFGKNGETGERQLRASDSALNKFERNRIDMFKIESPDIGELERIRIRHDGSLPNSGWFLDWVRIAVPSRGKQYLFAAHRWLDTNEADRKLEIDIDCSEVTDIERTIPYEIIVQTGDCKGAGTDAAVFVQIYGEDGLKTDQTLLRSRSDNFEKGKEDRFKLDLIDVGPIQKIRIGHDGTGFGDGWFLEHVLIRRHALRGSRRLKLNRKSSSQARNRSLSLAQSQQLNRRKSFAAAAEPYKKDYYDDEDDEDEDGVVDLDEDDISSRKKTGARRPSVRPASAKKRRDSSPAGNTRSRSRSPYDEDNDLRLSIGDDDDDKDSRRDSRLRRRSSAVQSSKSHGRGRRPSPFDDEEDDSDIDGEDEAGDRASSRRGTLRRPSSSVGDRRRSSVKQAPLRSADNRKNFNDDDNFDDSDDDLPSSSRGKKPPSSSPSGRRYSTRPSRAALTDSLEDGDGRASRRSSVRPGSDALRRRANSMIPLRGQQRSLWRVDEESEGGFSIDDAEMDQDDLDTESLTSARALAQKRSASMVSPSGIGSRRRSTIGPARSGEGVAAGSQRQSIRRGDSIGDGSSDLTSADGFDGWSIVTAEEEIEEYWFYCKRWLAKDEDDKMIVRELLPTTKDGKPLSRLSEIVYEVRVKTGDKLGAGTDANVFITLYGAEADSGERELSKSESHRNKFENNNEDVFRLKAIDLGELRKLKIRHDDKGGGADWYLDHVIVADPKSKKEYYFPCNKWLSTSRDGGQISRDLIAVDKSHMGKNVNENLKLEKKAFSDTYHVKVFTGDVRGAGTDANCHIVLFGDSGDSGVIPLQQSKTHVNKFERNNCDEFEIELVDIGELHKIQIGHDNANPWPDWYLEKVEIDCPRLGMSWVFPCGEWIGKSKGDGQLDKTLYPQQGVTKIYANRVPYEITTYTSDKSGAGTSANVFIQIYSAETQTEQALLCSKNERSGKFKRGSVDKFVLELEDVEDPIEKIRIGHDDEGIGSGWHLEKVEIRRFTAGNSSITYVFPCNRWLARDEEDREIVRELVPQKVIEEDDRMGGKGKAREKDFKSSLKMKNYKVHVFTGDKMGAGTNADVFLTVYGTKGDSGERELIKSEKNLDKFERGQEDIFAWEVVDLGQLYKIKIRHNDKGLFSNWFLDRVEVVDASSGEKSVFFAERWLSKSKDDKKLQVTVYAQGYEGDMNSSVSSLRSSGSALTERDRSPRSSVRRAASLTEAVPEGPVGDYTISFTTGRKREMGTEGPIWVRLYGRLPDKKQQRRRGGSFGASDGDRGGGVKRPSGAGIGGRRRRDNEIVTTGHVYLEQDSDTSQKDSKSKMLLVPGSTVKFTFEALMLSEVTKIEIGNEGVTPGKGWYLEEFRLELPTQGRRYVRRCKCWFARDKEDSKTVREFEFDTEDTESVQSYTPMIPYEVLIETANQAEAGTDCRVGLTVFGLKGQSETVYLDKEEKRFERGRKDLIKVNLEDVEPIYKLRLSHDGKGSRREWIVDRVTMTNLENSEVYTFDCGQHIGKDGKCFADMAARAGGGKALIGPVRYRISVKTSDERFSGTNANVFVRLYGEYGDSGDLRLNQLTKPDKKPFQTGQTDTFELELLDLGGLFRCTVWHDDVGLASGWKLDNIVVEDEKRRRRYEFPCGNWLSLRDSGLIKRDLLCDAPPGEDLTRDLEDPKRKVTYEITVQTGDKKDAGMPHDAFLFLEGDLDVMTGEFIMANSLDGERFARGSSDTFRMKHRNLGRLQTLRIGAVDNGAGDRKGYGDRGARGRRRDSQATDGASGTPKQQWNVFSVSVLDTGTGTQYSFPVNKWVPVEHDVRRKGGVTAEVDEIKETSTKARLAKKRDLKIVRYDVEVHTGEEFGSGTNANVSINLIGENGELGMTPLKQKNRDLFERKQVDRFPIECSDLGELKKIRIEHDNTGFRPDWLLSKVIVRDSSSGRVWNFNCNQWLSTKKGDMQLFKELYPSPA